ncbi:hypothetical protein JGS39_24045 [Streptomyces sp. P01-B04]|uniref:hypothetical protein n=1 Tax=Streptomyces poriferorum TaxID=2798799 RepID=UPI001C5FCC04|nr:hypothetical protein [Streptomyces poriferorum]MBW5252034.1 hypothetical protein [Streptomyces poriferorum]MBW5260204.1 hypothetical protein [Streptomyces poriferorum]
MSEERPAIEETAPPTSGDVAFPAYVTATTGAALWVCNRLVGHPLPPEIYVWVQLTVPLVMGRLAAVWRVRRTARQGTQ